MNVLYLTNNAGRASTTVATRGWFKHLMPRGLRPVLVSPTIGEFHEWAISRGIPSYQLPLPFPDKRKPLAFFQSLWNLSRLVIRHRVELIHCNEQDVYPVGKYLARLCGLKAIVTVHCAMQREFCEWAFRGSRGPDRMFFVSSKNLTVCTPGLRGIVPADKWRVLHNGLETDDYQPDEELRRAYRRNLGVRDEHVIGVACAFRPGKQLEHLFEAAAHLPSNVRVALAGGPVPGDEEYAKELLGAAKKLLGARLVHVGYLNDLRSFCNALDLFINTSQEEAFGIAPLEAMACGCPVVGYASKAVEEVVLPDGGEIVDQDSVAQLIAAIGHWLSDPVRLSEARTHARQQAQRFDIKSLSDTLWSEYHDLLS